MDEGVTEVPKVGTIKAREGFVVIATQNPREFVATTAISEALSDRFELILLDYQPEDEEALIVRKSFPRASEELIARAVWIGRRTRSHPNIRRGASVRAPMSITQLSSGLSSDLLEGIRKAAHMSLPTRIEMREESKATADEVIDEIVNECFALPPPSPGAPLRDEKEEEKRRKKRQEFPERRIDVADLVKVLEESSLEDIEGSDDLGWAIAQKYPQLRFQLRDAALVELAKRIAVKATIRRVLQLLGPVSIPTQLVREEFRPGTDSEIDVDSTLENIVDKAHLEISDIVVERRQPRSTAVALMLDASLSMSGDKLAIATASIAVLAYRLKMVDYLLITFNDRPTVVKRFHEARNLDDLISQLLDFNATGYTNIEWALAKGREELSHSETRNRVGVLVTDGNFTVGDDPSVTASAYRRLFVVMTESHDCRPEVCEAIARNGGGKMYEISSYDEMPRVLYKVLRMVALGAPPNLH
jgi:Mg-chelatase subunit ChlD